MVDTQNALFNTHERGEVRARASTLDAAISTYNRDLLTQLCFDASDAGDSLRSYLVDDLGASSSEADAIVAEAASAAAPNIQHSGTRAGTVPADAVKNEKTFYNGWSKFYGKWKLFFLRIQSFSLFGPSPDDAWNMLMQFEKDFSAWKEQGKSLFSVRSTAPELPALPEPAKTTTQGLEEFAKKALTYAALAGGGYLAFRYFSSRISERNMVLRERGGGGGGGGGYASEPYGYLPAMSRR